MDNNWDKTYNTNCASGVIVDMPFYFKPMNLSLEISSGSQTLDIYTSSANFYSDWEDVDPFSYESWSKWFSWLIFSEDLWVQKTQGTNESYGSIDIYLSLYGKDEDDDEYLLGDCGLYWGNGGNYETGGVANSLKVTFPSDEKFQMYYDYTASKSDLNIEKIRLRLQCGVYEYYEKTVSISGFSANLVNFVYIN